MKKNNEKLFFLNPHIRIQKYKRKQKKINNQNNKPKNNK